MARSVAPRRSAIWVRAPVLSLNCRSFRAGALARGQERKGTRRFCTGLRPRGLGAPASLPPATRSAISTRAGGGSGPDGSIRWRRWPPS